MKLIGGETTFGIAGALACFKDIDFEASIDMENTTSSCSDRLQQRPKPNSRTARISANDFVEKDSNANFIDLCVEGEVINISSMTALAQARLDFYAPWVVTRATLKHNATDASENGFEAVGTGGGMT